MLYDLKYSRSAVTFCATVHFLYPLKTSENLWFSDVFRGYRKKLLTCNGLMTVVCKYTCTSAQPAIFTT